LIEQSTTIDCKHECDDFGNFAAECISDRVVGASVDAE
jgi:hypothetical protein